MVANSALAATPTALSDGRAMTRPSLWSADRFLCCSPGSPCGFRQKPFCSQAAETILVDEVRCAIGAARPVLDLFAGLGTFALALVDGGSVHAVESEVRAVAALAKAAASRPRLAVERRDLARNPIPTASLSRYAAAVFNPPRTGAAGQAAAFAASALERVVAISCNPATIARDAATLIGGGFRLERVTPIDQFVWAPHLELGAAFKR
jgi:23S rRNA (uracil1939-C5)-methyltransferase